VLLLLTNAKRAESSSSTQHGERLTRTKVVQVWKSLFDDKY
jgi:hypothetical protein